MPNDNEVARQLEILHAHRQTLTELLKQKALIGDAFIQPATAHGINNARNEINRIKAVLRSWYVTIDDHPDDNPPSNSSQGLEAMAQSEKQLSSLQQNTKTPHLSKQRTIVEAIKEVLKKANRPMSSAEIYNAIVREDLYIFGAKDPQHVVNSQIRRHCKGLDFPTALPEKHFSMVSKGKYSLLPDTILQSVSNPQQVVIIENKERIKNGSQDDIANRSDNQISAKITRDQVFISYSHRDLRFLQRLQTHLKTLRLSRPVTCWDDTKIKPGALWREEIQKAINTAKVAILLVSTDFLASEFIASNELPPLLVAAEQEGALILPVIIAPCRFTKDKSLSRFQSVNLPSRPLSKMTKSAQEEVYMKVIDAIESALFDE